MAINDSREIIIQKRKYSPTIHGDQYSLYLSNTLAGAQYLSERIGGANHVVAELCCSVGITLSAMARVCKKIIGVELDPVVLADCRKNLVQDGVLDKVELLQGDVSHEDLLRRIHADIVIYDIPYWISKKLPDGSDVLEKNPNFQELVQNIQKWITPNVVIFAPANFDVEQIAAISNAYEFQRVYIGEKYNRNYIYLGNLIQTLGVTEIHLPA